MDEKHYIVDRISGDYAYLRDTQTGTELCAAMALLPEETDEGVKLLWKNLTYTAEE